jgi:hypothetical protein
MGDQRRTVANLSRGQLAQASRPRNKSLASARYERETAWPGKANELRRGIAVPATPMDVPFAAWRNSWGMLTLSWVRFA